MVQSKQKELIFSYGSLILQENLEKFNSEIISSVFVKKFKLKVELSPITKTNYHYIYCIETLDEKDIIPGYLIQTNNIEEIDKWEGDSYVRTKIKCFNRRMNEIECFIYLKKY